MGDRGVLGRTSGNYCTVIGHNPDEQKERISAFRKAKHLLNVV